jgi:hypothetical protein
VPNPNPLKKVSREAPNDTIATTTYISIWPK